MGTIPQTVTLPDLLEAMKPLMALLGITHSNVYAVPGLSIVGDQIVFTTATGEELPSGRRAGVRAENHPQGDEFAELAHIVRVQVVR